MWARGLPFDCPLKTRLRSPFQALMPDLPQALQRADIAVASTLRAALHDF
jgi:hypothetical protein